MSDTPAAAPALPEGVRFDFANRLRSDRVVATAAGGECRRTVLEFRGGVAPLAAQLRAAMKAAGFRAGRLRDKDADTQLLHFAKDGYGKVRAVIRTGEGLKLQDAAAAGTLRLDWPA